MQEPKAKAALVPFGEPKGNAKARNADGGGGKRAKEGLEGIQENLRIAKEAKRELEGIEEDQEEVHPYDAHGVETIKEVSSDQENQSPGNSEP